MKGDLIERLTEEAERNSKSIMSIHPHAKALCKEAAERLGDLDRKLDQAIDMLGDRDRAALLFELSKDS